MELCDNFRDQKLVDLGVKLEDKVDETGNPIIKLADRESLIKEREEKARIQKEKEEKKRLAAEKKAKEEAEKVPHIDMIGNAPLPTLVQKSKTTKLDDFRRSAPGTTQIIQLGHMIACLKGQ